MLKLLIGLLALATPTFAVAAPPPPQALQSYIREGRFNPGDYGWMRGEFARASAEDKAAAEAIKTWLKACFEEGRDQTRTALESMGIADPKLETTAHNDALCAAVALRPNPTKFSSFKALQDAAAAAKPIVETYLMAVEIAQGHGGPRDETLAAKLLARPLSEQMLRSAMGWGNGQLKDAPSISPEIKAIVLSQLGAALVARDRANTAWLKSVVDERGWPKISEVGKPAARQAWLLVQHADADPAFQLTALRLMEPLLASGEVGKSNFAYLYDRVMLKISGKQRFGTQATCRAGKRVPEPLESESGLAKSRTDVGLPPLAEYFEMMEERFGPCPADG